MKFQKIILHLLLVFNLSIIVAQERPFGTINVGNNINFDETEIDVASWLSFYSWTIVHEGYSAAQRLLPDSSGVEPELWSYIKNSSSNYIDIPARYSSLPVGYFEKECKDCVKFENRLPKISKFCAMLNFPITGISYEQAVSFCEWRTKIEGGNDIIFRLPTPEEWRNFALFILNVTEQKIGLRDSVNNKKCAEFNYRISFRSNNVNCQGMINGIGLYSPMKGAYDAFGNISEMTSLKGIALGGNFKLYANQCHIDSIQKYTRPEKWLGFRCISVKNLIPKTVNKGFSIDEKTEDHFGKFTDSRDGKTYPTVIIGNQTWFAANLTYKPDTGKYWAWGNIEKNVDQYGYLYNWETAKNVCPVGWHLPSKEEFEVLLENVGGNESKAAYEALLPSGSSGYSIVLAGFRRGMSFAPLGLGGCFCSSSEYSKRRIWAFGVGTGIQKARLSSAFSKKDGLSVRCVQD